MYFVEDFESTAPDVTIQGGWGIGTPSGGGPTPPQGAKCLGIGLTGPYPNGVNDLSLTAPINLTGATQPILVFKHWYDTEAGIDGGRILVQPAGQILGQVADPVVGYPSIVEAFGPDAGYAGSSGGQWVEARFDLTPYAGQNGIAIQFMFSSDGGVNKPGWFIDDVKIGELATIGGTAGPPGTVIFSEMFEATPAATQPAAGASAWQIGAPTAGPGSAAQGTKVAATALSSGQYADDTGPEKLVTPYIDFGPSATSAYLRFRHWYSMESNYDGGRIVVSSNGSSWVVVTPQGGYPDPYVYAINDEAYSGSSGGWRTVIVDLAPLFSNAQVGRRFQIGFEFASDFSITDIGWYIDNVEVFSQ
jgi:bacillopeptidase F (M6 metalloprotease family)